MKALSTVLASSVMAVLLMGGCAMNPHHSSENSPRIKVTVDSHNISAGTTTRVYATTMNVVGGSDIKWSVSPNVAKITPDGAHATTALFSANQQGTYSVKASVDLGNGQWVSDYVDITVNGVDSAGRPIDNNNNR